MGNSKLRIGIIGCGAIANTKHMPALKQLSELCETVAFCDIIEERALRAATEYGASDAAVYQDYTALLANDSVDVVHVCTPNVSHSEITVKAFDAGKHVLCEKPMSHSAAEAERMMDAWRRSGKKFTIGYQNRFSVTAQTLHDMCRADTFGEIYMAKAHAIRRRAVPTWGVFPKLDKQGGGALIDIGTHALDITLWMMNNYKPKSVTGSVYHKLRDHPEGNLFGPWDPEQYEVEDSAFGYVKMENGATIFIESSWALNMIEEREAATTLCGTLAGAEIRTNHSTNDPMLLINGVQHGQLMESTLTDWGKARMMKKRALDMGYAQTKQWLEAIRRDEEPVVRPEEALVVTKILDAIYLSDKEDRMITLL